MKNGLIIGFTGNKAWYLNNQLHRTDGPAVEWANGIKEWWVEGKRHRMDGPAVEWANGDKEWWVGGVLLDDHPLSTWLKQMNLYNKFKQGELNQERLMEIKMVFGL